MALTKPSFIDRDANEIVQEMIAFYEAATGKILQPAQAERLMINAFAYRELLLRNSIQAAAEQNLVSFSSAPILDALAELVGVIRLEATAAEVVITFSLVSGHGALVLPEGTRVSSSDGKAVFATKEPYTILITDSDVDVQCICQQEGVIGNGYLAGSIVSVLDPQPYIVSASNAATTADGSDPETDEQLRERVKLAPSSFSTAGSIGAYKFHAQSAHPSIIDVGVRSIIPGTVEIYPLVDGGIATPAPILAAVEDICSGEKVRPLTDTVLVLSPVEVLYAIEVELILLTNANQTDIETAANEAYTLYTESKITTLGRDVIINQIIGVGQVENVYKVNVILPAADIIINEYSFAKCTGITVTTVGFNNG